jgi:hypothetical protein
MRITLSATVTATRMQQGLVSNAEQYDLHFSCWFYVASNVCLFDDAQ